jgi:uncharacterized protein
MTATTITDGEILLPGVAQGLSVSLTEPLSFWGGFDVASGHVIDRRHPQWGLTLSGRVVVMAAARGSSSGSSVLAEAIRIGTAPSAFIVTERDAILVVGAMVALELYGTACPIVRVGETELERLRLSGHIEIDATGSPARVTHTPK